MKDTNSCDDHRGTMEGKIRVRPWKISKDNVLKDSWGSGTVAHACNLALWEAKVGGSPEVRSSRPNWPKWRNLISTKNKNISWVWWHMLVIPAIWEARAGELLEPRRWRLQWPEITPLPSSLGDTARLHQKHKRVEDSQGKESCTFFSLPHLQSLAQFRKNCCPVKDNWGNYFLCYFNTRIKNSKRNTNTDFQLLLRQVPVFHTKAATEWE